MTDREEGKIRDSIKIEGFVTIYQEDEKGNRTYLVRDQENHYVDACLKGLLSAMVGNYVISDAYWSYSAWASGWTMYLGTDTTTPTTHGMTALVSPIGAAPGTEPNTKWGVDIANPSVGVWKFKVTAVWNLGTISGTVGEIALYFRPMTLLTYLWTESITTKAIAMISRLSVADGDFSAIPIDPSKSFTVEWEVRLSYE